MKNENLGKENKVKFPVNNTTLPMINIRNKVNEIQMNNKLKNKNNLIKSNSFCGNSKPIYDNFLKDKETLYEKNLQLRSELFQVRKELFKIKSENKKKENLINKKENIINSTFDINEDQYNIIIEESKMENNNDNENNNKCLHFKLINKLKKQYNELKKEFENKDKDIYLLKQNIKNSRLNELMLENSIILKELNKLNNLYNHQIEENNNLNLKKNTIKEIEINISKQHYIILNLQKNINQSNEENSNLKKENTTLKSEYKQKSNKDKENNERINKIEEEIRNIILEKEILKEKNNILKNQINNLNIENNKEKITSNKSISSINGVKNAQITEITYILIKNFEAKKIRKEEALDKIFKSVIDNLYGESQVEKSGLVENFTDKICDLINCNNNEIDRNKIYYLIESLLTTSNNELKKFMENFLQLFDNIKFYNQNDDILFTQKIKNQLNNYKSYLNQNYKKEFISFFSFRILLNKQKIILDDDTVEYLIFRMKKDCKNNNNNSMFDLCFKTLIDILNNENEIEGNKEKNIINEEKNENSNE